MRTLARDRRCVPARRQVTHVALPGYEIGRATPRRRETVTALLRRTGWADPKRSWHFRNGLPTILLVNGEPVLRKHWRHTRIGANDNVQFMSRPLGGQNSGGGGKQVIGLVALIAVAAFATFITGGGAAVLFGSAFGAGTFGAAALGAVIGLGGALAINALTAPKPGATNDPNAKTDQIYTASAAGNTAKIGQPLPVGYGREKVFPDFAATPWGEFVANDQYQNILLSVGLGRYDYEQMFIDDTPLWNPIDGVAAAFSSAQIEFYDPSEQVTLFPTSVVASSEVSGQQLPHGSGISGSSAGAGPSPTPGDWIGGYIVNASGTVAQAIAVDFVFPAGCFRVDGNKTLALTVGLRAEYRTVNGAGAPTGAWTQLFEINRSYSSRSPIRDSVKVDVADGRYEVRFRRNDGVPDSSAGASDVIWAGLRAFLKGTNTFPVSTIAIRIKGTESTQGSFKFGALRTRILPVWNSGSATFVDQPTRNPAWAFLDAVSNSEYGSGHSLSKVDFNTVVNFAAGCEARGDHFDYTFSSAVAIPAALDTMLTPARSRHFWLGDTISVVRDEWRDVPSMLLTDREIVRDSTQVNWTMLGEEDPDAVILEYIDQDTWRPAQVQYPPEVIGVGGFHAANAETKRVDGIVDRDHAYREAAFYYLQSIYRREKVQIGTEYEGRAITYGSVLRVQSELPMAFGYGGAIVDRSGNTLTLDPPPSWADAGAHYIRIRRPNGKWLGPVLVTKGGSDNFAVLDAGSLATAVSTQGVTLTDALAREAGGEDPSFEVGTADNQSRLCVVLGGQPNGNQCTLSLVVDDPRVHATDIGTPPVLPTVQYPVDLKAPLIVGLNATFGQGVVEPKLSASWFPAAGAFYYVAEVSYDDGANWIQVYEGRDNKFDAVVTLAALTLRVQAVGKLHGPYSQEDLAAPTIEWLGEAIGLQSLLEGVRTQVTDVIDSLNDRLAYAEMMLSSVTANQDARNWKDKRGLRDQTNSIRESLTLSLGEANADIEEVRTVAVGTAGALATFETSVTAQFGTANAAITTNQTAIAALDGSFSSFQTSVTAQFGTANSAITTNASAISALNSSFGSYQTSVNASLGSLNSSVTTNSSAIATLNGYAAAKYSVRLDVNGYATGFDLINAGTGVSAFNIVADKFQVAQPDVAGGAVVPVFVIANVNGVPKLALRGDMYVDGDILTRHLAAGSVKTITLDAQAVTAVKMAAESITAGNGAIQNLSVQSLKIGDNAVNVIQAASVFGPFGTSGGSFGISTILSLTLTTDSTGLSGKQINNLVQAKMNYSAYSGTGNYLQLRLYRIKNGATAVLLQNYFGSNLPGGGYVIWNFIDSYVSTGDTDTFQYYITQGSTNFVVSDVLMLVTGVKR